MVYQRKRRWSTQPTAMIVYPQYEWAFDPSGQPVHISEAGHEGHYVCPVCSDRLIPKLGGVKQHHFAHERMMMCNPDQVTRTAVGRWLVIQIGMLIRRQRQVVITWKCPLCKQTHSENLLEDVAQVVEQHAHDGLVSDVALLDSQGRVRAAFALKGVDNETLTAYARLSITVIVLSLSHMRHRIRDLESLLSGVVISGGICATQVDAERRGILATVEHLREALTQAVLQPPYAVYGALAEDGDLTHVLTLGTQKMWLPPILWQRAVGGLLHTINPALHIISQEWKQPDEATIALYYVTLKGAHAVAVRRFPAGQIVYARLDPSVFKVGRMTALSAARSFAEL